MNHIFQPEQFFADRLQGKDPGAAKYEGFTLDELRRLHEQARAELLGYTGSATDEDLRRQYTIGPVSASSRKILARAALHSVHHWSQIAMDVRQAGFPTDPPQEITITDVME